MDPREEMLRTIRDEFARTAPWTGVQAPAPAVLEAMRRVPREAFVPDADPWTAHADRAVAIGHGQTISQPFIVALMTTLAAPAAGDRVLDVGTGSGYQAAILSGLADEVVSIERIPELAAEAGARLARQGLTNVTVRVGDGALGAPDAAPFDAIVVAAAAARVPPALVDQLAPGGRLVLPVDGHGDRQQLTLVRRDRNGRVHTRVVLPVRFVPLVES